MHAPRPSEASPSPYKIRIARQGSHDSMMRPATVQLLLGALLLSAPLSAQTPRIGGIEFYGLRDVAKAELRAVLDVTVGETQPASTGEIVYRLEQIPGVNRAYVTTVCCENGEAILYVGVQEEDSAAFELRTPPQGDVTLPAEVVDTHRHFGEALRAAVLKGDARDDMSAGHSLMADPEVRAHQEQFLVFAERVHSRGTGMSRRFGSFGRTRCYLSSRWPGGRRTTFCLRLPVREEGC